MDGNERHSTFCLDFGFQFVRFSSAADESSTAPNVDKEGGGGRDKRNNILAGVRWVGDHFLTLGLGLVWFGGWVGKLGSCTEKTSAPDEAKPAGACLSRAGTQDTAPASSGKHAL